MSNSSFIMAGVAALMMILMSGCDPVITIAGANFPGWLICAGAGAILAALCRPLLAMSGMESYLRPLPFFYGAVIVMFSLIAWLIFFAPV
ncbi:MAG: YtcA family lipoprotein [Terriglobia bacterium]